MNGNASGGDTIPALVLEGKDNKENAQPATGQRQLDEVVLLLK